MKLRNLLSAASVALFTSTSLFAGDVMVMDAYARVASKVAKSGACLLYTSPSPRDRQKSRMPSSA